MMKTVAVFALAVGLVGPASAATTTLDFTADNVTSTGLYTVTGSGALTNSTHGNAVGCTGSGWDFACNTSGGQTDVGFGVAGVNSNEIDAVIRANEWVQVTFAYAVKIVAFAGMLTYNGSQDGEGTETVVLQYLTAGGLWVDAPAAGAINDDNDNTNIGNDNFGTVGLAWLDGLSIDTTAVRFTAGGTGTFDDGNANVTAAGLKVAPVPIPASFPLLLAGLGALGFAARRKQRKSA